MNPRADFYERISNTLGEIRDAGLEKIERPITSPQGPVIEVEHKGVRRRVLNFCANNYLGLADHPDVVAAAKKTMDAYGFGMASVRFICGTSDLHLQVEEALAFGDSRFQHDQAVDDRGETLRSEPGGGEFLRARHRGPDQ